jgi:maltodextrin utilization protein YvdJ
MTLTFATLVLFILIGLVNRKWYSDSPAYFMNALVLIIYFILAFRRLVRFGLTCTLSRQCGNYVALS